MKIDPRHLEILSAVVEHGGITEAAEVLHKTQPSLSRAITSLEQRIGEPLFEKGKRPLRPTPLCQALALKGDVVREAGQGASELVDSFINGSAGVIRVGGTPVFIDGVVSYMLAKYQLQHSDIKIEQSYGYLAELVSQINGGTLDVGIVPIEPDAEPEGFTFHRLLPGRNVIACSARHTLAKRPLVKLSDLLNYSWIAPPATSPLYHDLRLVLNSLGVTDFKVSFSGGSLASLINVLAESDSLTVLPYSVVYMMQNQASITPLSLKIDHPKRNLGMLLLQQRATDRRLERFCQFLNQEFDSLSNRIHATERESIWRS